jgi:hypothetical protein
LKFESAYSGKRRERNGGIENKEEWRSKCYKSHVNNYFISISKHTWKINISDDYFHAVSKLLVR